MWRTLIILASCLLSTALCSIAQNNYNNHWWFGRGQCVNFNNNIIQNGGMPEPPVPFTYRLTSNVDNRFATVSHPQTGALQFFFYVYYSILSGANHSKYVFFDRDGYPMPNSEVYISYFNIGNGNPIIVPHPHDTQKYYVFTCFNLGLQYSIVDMALNNGKGDVDSNYKMIPLLPPNTVFGNKMTIAPTCNALYLIIRRTDTLAFNSFSIDQLGVQHQPTYSNAGTQTPITYLKATNHLQTIKASPNGSMLMEALTNGVELYDIRPCDGAIINPRMIDTVPSFSGGFSPDSKILYTTRKEYATNNFESSEIVQWDVSKPQDLNQIKLSEYVVLINSAHNYPGVMINESGYMGDVAIGKDQKMYVAANIHYRSNMNPYPVFPSTTVPDSQVLHIIHQPNVLGIGCQVERDGFPIKGDRQQRGDYLLPHPIYEVPSTLPDTIYRPVDSFYNCFGKGLSLSIANNATCIQWYNGKDSTTTTTKDTGYLWVRYAIDCQWYVDSFYVKAVPVPYVPQTVFGCEGHGLVQVQHPPSDLVYHYTLENDAYGWERKGHTSASDSIWKINYLPSGSYSLHIKAGTCDTTIQISINAYEQPNINIAFTQDTLVYGTGTSLTASGARIYTWFPHLGLDTTMGASVWAQPPYSMRYEVIGINDYGCRDTAFINLFVKDSARLFIPNAFSPNNDGLNDAVGIFATPNIKVLRWAIYDRWGTMVFQTQDGQARWDGQHHGQPCDVGVYFYLVEFVVGRNGHSQQQRGELHLIR